MTRLSISAFHTFLGCATTTGAVLFLLQALANGTWEWAFYGELSGMTISLGISSLVLLGFGIGHAASALTWFAGSTWGGWTLLAASVVLVGAYPAPIALLVTFSAVLVALDLMVQHHRREAAPPP